MSTRLTIVIENGNDKWTDIEESYSTGYSDGYYCKLSNGEEWVLFETHESAGECAREYWEEMANDDPEELICMVGKETLVKWALGQYAGPGSEQVKSLEEWLDLWEDNPEDHWGGYDGEEYDVKVSRVVRDDFGWWSRDYVVGYRHN